MACRSVNTVDFDICKKIVNIWLLLNTVFIYFLCSNFHFVSVYSSDHRKGAFFHLKMMYSRCTL